MSVSPGPGLLPVTALPTARPVFLIEFMSVIVRSLLRRVSNAHDMESFRHRPWRGARAML
jgi:hypothetical protein